MASFTSPVLLYPIAGGAGLVLLLLLVGKVPLSYTLRNLTIRWRTTLMTALAFTLVVSLLTVMLAFVNGMYRLTESSGQPGNVIVLSDGATDEIFSNISAADVGELEQQPGILRENDRPLASRETYMILNQPIPNAPRGRPQRRFLQLRGVEDPQIAGAVHGLEIYPGGRWFASAGVEELPDLRAANKPAAIQAVLGEGLARQLSHDRTPEELAAAKNPERLEPGDRFSLSNRTWVVIGILQSGGSTFDSELWCKRSIIAPLFGKNTYTSVVLRTAGAAEAESLKDYFNNQYKRAAVLAQVETKYFASLGNTSKQFLYAIIFVTIVMSIGGVFGVMNTMFAAISQRIKDIGVLRLVGYGRLQVLVAFLLESVAIALVGGMMGCALGTIADGWSATSIVSSGPGGGKFVVLKLAIDAPLLSVGMLLSLGMGIIGGLVPALSAMRLRPLEALR